MMEMLLGFVKLGIAQSTMRWVGSAERQGIAPAALALSKYSGSKPVHASTMKDWMSKREGRYAYRLRIPQLACQSQALNTSCH